MLRNSPRKPAGLGAVAALAILLGAGAAHAVTFTSYPIPTPDSAPFGITTGPDGQIWFTEADGHKIGMLSTDGVFGIEIPMGHSPRGIAAVPGNALAFAAINAGQWGLLGVDGGWAEYAAGIWPWGVVAGPDGRIWIADHANALVTALHYLPDSLPTVQYDISSFANGIAVGPDFRVWVTIENDLAPRIAACAPGGDSCVEYPLPPGTRPVSITAGPDGNLWFTDQYLNKVGRITTDGNVTMFPVPTGYSSVTGICAGPDGNLWFTESTKGKVGRITPKGVITEFDVPGVGSPTSITPGPDGNIWFVDESGNKVYRMTLFVPGDVNEDGKVTVADVLYLINFLFAGGPAPH